MAALTFAASAARTASGSGTAVSALGQQTTLRVQLNVTAAAGTSPTLDVVLEDTVDGANWNVVATFTQKIAPGREVVNITTPFTDSVRTRWTVAGGTPSFTFDVLGYAE